MADRNVNIKITKQTPRRRSSTEEAAAPAPAPQPEEAPADFNSVVLTIDHIATQTRAPEHTIRKWVTSTQTLAESLIALLGYYGESHLLARESTLDLIAEAKRAPHPVVVYQTPQNIQIVASGETFALIAMGWGNGSLLLGSEMLEATVAQIVANQLSAQGGVVPLTLFSLSTEDPDQTA